MMKLVTPKVEDRKDFELTLDEIAQRSSSLMSTLLFSVHFYFFI